MDSTVMMQEIKALNIMNKRQNRKKQAKTQIFVYFLSFDHGVVEATKILSCRFYSNFSILGLFSCLPYLLFSI